MNEIIIKDNFLSNPDLIRKIALDLEYNQPRVIDYRSIGIDRVDVLDNWRGYRHWFEEILNVPKEKILNTICSEYNLNSKNYYLNTCFHYSLEKTKSTCFPSFEEYKYHRDSDTSVYAGLIYLYPDPPKHSGTTIITSNNTKNYLENVYNRMIVYPSNFLHGPTDLFGNDIKTSRLTLTFFLENKQSTK